MARRGDRSPVVNKKRRKVIPKINSKAQHGLSEVFNAEAYVSVNVAS